MKKNFVKETKSELKKVTWPTRKQVVSGTGVVIVMVAIVGVIIFAFDSMSASVVKFITTYNYSITENSESGDIDHTHEENEATTNLPEAGTTDGTTVETVADESIAVPVTPIEAAE